MKEIPAEICGWCLQCYTEKALTVKEIPSEICGVCLQCYTEKALTVKEIRAEIYVDGACNVTQRRL